MNFKSDKYLTATLPNGLRVVAAKYNGEVSYVGAMVGVGSRYETPDEFGLAHFVEHTLFKGTLKRKSWHIANRMESIGGELNAYTTKEETMIYTNAPKGYVDRSLELISDIIINSQFPEKDINREKDVIIEEINSYLDSPADSVFDDFEDLIYAGSGLAHNILGSAQSVKALSGESARRFINRHYAPQNIVVYCCDPGDPEKNIRLVEKYFGALNRPYVPTSLITPPPVAQFNQTRNDENNQANSIIGARLFGRNDNRRHALFLLNNFLGGPCMNSRFNTELRDKRGLVYTVESNVSLMSDTGLWVTYFGTDPKTAKKCLRLISSELEKLATKTLPDNKFEAIRNQYCGQLIMSGENRESRAMALAKSIAYYNEIHDLEYTAQKIRALSPLDLREIAELILNTGLSSLTLA